MIDFRYHLVSIVSIFLALAVGIVLGAGPLKEDLGNTLTEQVTALRKDKADLRGQVEAADKATQARDSYAAAVGPAVVAGRLSGKTISLVLVPGADSGLVKQVTTTLSSAGAKVGSTVSLNDAWADPAKRAERNSLAASLASLVKAPTGASNPDLLPGVVLARAILAGNDNATDRLAPSASQAIDGLVAANLLTVSPDQVVPASGVVMVGAPVKGSDPADTTARLNAYVLLAQALDSAGSGTVVVSASNQADPTQTADLVAALRRSTDAGKVVSTVDDVDLAMGQATMVLALAEQYNGGAGQYGLGSDARAVVPDTVGS